jgi:hypothetical protein
VCSFSFVISGYGGQMGAVVEQLGSCLSKTEVSATPLMKSKSLLLSIL